MLKRCMRMTVYVSSSDDKDGLRWSVVTKIQGHKGLTSPKDINKPVFR